MFYIIIKLYLNKREGQWVVLTLDMEENLGIFSTSHGGEWMICHISII